jgi:hypothetical protein
VNVMDVSFLRPLFADLGPWVSVYLDASRDTEDAAHAVELRWRAVRDRLAEQHVDEATVAALDRGVHDDPGGDGRRGLALFAAAGTLALAVPLPEPPAADAATVSRLPRVLPLLAALDEPVAWVQAVVDRTGADLVASPGWRPPRHREVAGGEAYPLRKTAPGGWSQRRYQRAAETSWDRNAEDVAAAVARAAEEVDAQVLVLAGDERARGLLVEHLPARWAPLVRVVEGSRAPGAAPQRLDGGTQAAIRAVAEHRRATALDDLRAGQPADRARTGLDEVVAAAREAHVRTLLLDPAGVDARLWVGLSPTDMATEPGALRSLGITDVAPAPADDALIRAAAATDADVLLVADGSTLSGGVGAVLRYPG